MTENAVYVGLSKGQFEKSMILIASLARGGGEHVPANAR